MVMSRVVSVGWVIYKSQSVSQPCISVECVDFDTDNWQCRGALGYYPKQLTRQVRLLCNRLLYNLFVYRNFACIRRTRI